MSKFFNFLSNLKPTKAEIAALVGIVLLAGYTVHKVSKTASNPKTASVMIVNRAMNSGGTGIILSSSNSSSWILTNDHVCGVVKDNGGVVRTNTGDYQVNAIAESQVSDLCLVNVLDDLGVNTTVSPTAPATYDAATISGHPALMPNVLSKGHVSGRAIIQVVTGFKDCTQADLDNPDTGLLCMFLGGIPVLKSYESVLVTALIQPGSSGSGIYNNNDQLVGVVFAGAGGIGYAWTVPYEQVVQFLTHESQSVTVKHINNEINYLAQQTKTNRLADAIKKCEDIGISTVLDTEQKREFVKSYCSIIKRDAIWVK